jgi:hypothetical protein
MGSDEMLLKGLDGNPSVRPVWQESRRDALRLPPELCSSGELFDFVPLNHSRALSLNLLARHFGVRLLFGELQPFR